MAKLTSMIVVGVVVLLHGFFSGLFWFLALAEHGGRWTDYSLSAAMSHPPAGSKTPHRGER